MRIAAVTLALSISPALAAEEYEINLKRHYQVGQVFKLSAKSKSARETAATQDGKAVDGGEPRYSNMKLVGIFEVLQTDATGFATELHSTGVNLEKIEKNGLSRNVLTDAEVMVRSPNLTTAPTFLLGPNRRPMPPEADARLRAFFTAKLGSNANFNPAGLGKKKKGDTWDLDIAALAREMKQLKTIDPKKMKGTGSLHDIVMFDGIKCLDVRFEMITDKIDVAGIRGADRSTSVGTTTLRFYLPVDPSLPVAGTHTKVVVDFESSGTFDGKESELKITHTEEQTTKTTLVK